MKHIELHKIFGSKCRAKILEKFFLEAEGGNNSGFHMRGLSRDLEEQINSIKRELDNLTELGILKSKTELKKKFFFLNQSFYLLNEFMDIFLKSYDPFEKIKNYYKNQHLLELIIINNSIKTKLLESGKSILDIFMIGEIDKENLKKFLEQTFFGRKVKYAIISTEDFYNRLNYGDKLIKNILTENGNIFLKDNLNIKAKLNIKD